MATFLSTNVFSTSKPFGVVFDCSQSRIVPQTPVYHGINGQEIRHGCSEEIALCGNITQNF